MCGRLLSHFSLHQGLTLLHRWTFEHLLVILGMTLAVAAPSPMAPGLNDRRVNFVLKTGTAKLLTGSLAAARGNEVRSVALGVGFGVGSGSQERSSNNRRK